jgi:hypothetical protein
MTSSSTSSSLSVSLSTLDSSLGFLRLCRTLEPFPELAFAFPFFLKWSIIAATRTSLTTHGSLNPFGWEAVIHSRGAESGGVMGVDLSRWLLVANKFSEAVSRFPH